jgi:glycosyltransferase involved in cell wall biosynthesis
MLVSIITVVFSGAPTLEATIKSVLANKTKEVEYIVIDGGSTDGSVNIINSYSNKIDYWISEPDKGIYDAMNKGITASSGFYVCFINSGDTLLEIPIKSLASANADMICFPIKLDSSRIRRPSINWKFKIANTLPHQGIFYKRQPALKFDTNYAVFADYALNADYVLGKKVIKLMPSPIIASHNLDGISNNKKSSKELFKMIREKFGWTYIILSFLYFKLRGLYFRFHSLCL